MFGLKRDIVKQVSKRKKVEIHFGQLSISAKVEHNHCDLPNPYLGFKCAPEDWLETLKLAKTRESKCQSIIKEINKQWCIYNAIPQSNGTFYMWKHGWSSRNVMLSGRSWTQDYLLYNPIYLMLKSRQINLRW